jgi:hypothetical protein
MTMTDTTTFLRSCPQRHGTWLLIMHASDHAIEGFRRIDCAHLVMLHRTGIPTDALRSANRGCLDPD